MTGRGETIMVIGKECYKQKQVAFLKYMDKTLCVLYSKSEKDTIRICKQTSSTSLL